MDKGLRQSGLLTLKDALYGTAIGKFATIANSRLGKADRNARLCEISWIAKKRF
jgi:hypothetical protein